MENSLLYSKNKDTIVSFRDHTLFAYAPATGNGFVGRGLLSEVSRQVLSFLEHAEVANLEVLSSIVSGVPKDETIRSVQALALEGVLVERKVGELESDSRKTLASISIVGSPDLAKRLMHRLDRMSLRAHYEFSADVMSGEPALKELVVGVFGHEQLDEIRKWNRRSILAGSHFLPVVVLGPCIELGPYVIPGRTACYECYLTRIHDRSFLPFAIDAGFSTNDLGSEIRAVIASREDIALALASIEISKLSSRKGCVPSCLSQVVEFNVDAMTSKSSHVIEIPHCASCQESPCELGAVR